MSSHDILYNEETIDVEEEDGAQALPDSQENPFSSPTKATQLTIHTPTEPESRANTKKVIGKSQRALQKNTSETGDGNTSFKTLGDRTNGVAKNENAYGKYTYKTIDQFFDQADRLSSDGRREDAMEILMDAIDHFYDGLEKHQKMQLHGRISSIAYELRWL